MFPGAGATVYRNEAGEVTGWDNSSYYEPEYDPDVYLDRGGDYEEHSHQCRECKADFDCPDPDVDYRGDCRTFGGLCEDCEDALYTATPEGNGS